MQTRTPILPPLEYPAAALPHIAEEQALSACLGDSHTIYRLRDDPAVGLDWRHFAGDATRPIAEAIWNLVDPALAPDGKPRTVERGNVIIELQRLGYWETVVRPDLLRRLDNNGSSPVVRAAPEYARLVRDAAIARNLAAAGREFTERVLMDPSGARGYAGLHVDQVTKVITHTGQVADHSIQRHNSEEFADVPGIYTGIPFFDVTAGGCGEAEMIGWQGVFKDGKTRTMLMSILRLLMAGVPTVVLTTDNRARMLRNRLAVLIATDHMMRDKVEHLEMTLDPKRLSPRYLSETQQRYLEKARQFIDDVMKLWVLDATDGIQDFQKGYEWLHRYIRPPFNCRIWVWDHLADLSYKGSQDWDAFKQIVNTLKTANQEWGTTGIPINQKKEGGDGVRSHMGGAFPQALDYMYEPRTFTVWEKDADTGEDIGTKVVDVKLSVSRWSEGFTHRYIVNPSSGYFTNPFTVPSALTEDREKLPYIMLKRGTWDVERDGDPYNH
ncbi:hypothetical protein SE17_00010 [Kouleothrix aurantiaca]|uniref:Uncharacterized protein n=1 Tax=Kouleothrix aurantiaca TaxID=186479 RepID=A0A0P9D7N9_9CHLR|nr:hypothetical protein SE17_00010 [Kouleothrix aurantiaca]